MTTQIHRNILSLAAILIAAPTSAAVIDVQSTAKPISGLIRLGDVARIDDADPQLVKQLAAVTLGPGPAQGRKLRVSQQAIRERLIAHGVNLTDIEFAGQSLIVIEGPSNEPKVAAEKANPNAVRQWSPTANQRTQADKNVQTAFHRQFQSDGSDVRPLKLTVEISERDVMLLGKVDPDSVQFVEPGLEWGGPQTLTAKLPAADGATHVVRMQAWLNESLQIVTVKHAIPKGQVLRDDDLVTKPAAEGETGIEHPEKLIGREATRTLRPGSPLQHGDVVRTPLVRNNDLVTVRVKTPGLSVSRVFRAQSSGAEGDVVNLVALEDPLEKVQAMVTGWHEAEMIGANSARAVPAEQSRQTSPATEEPLRLRGRR